MCGWVCVWRAGILQVIFETLPKMPAAGRQKKIFLGVSFQKIQDSKGGVIYIKRTIKE